MKRTRARTRRLKTAVSVYDLSKRSRPDHCARKGRQSRVSRCPGRVLYHHYGLARIGNSEVFFVLLSLLSLCFVIIIKYSRAQEGKKHHTPIIIPLCCSRALTAIVE